MILPTTYYATMALLVLGMLLWGTWANTYKLSGNWRFELYYFDFALGMMLTAAIAAFTLGTLGFDGFSFRDDVLHASKKQDVLALLAGVVFNLGSMLLVAAISLSGMSIAIPVSLGLSLVIGSIWTYRVNPQGSSVLLFAGATIVVLAIVAIAQAYKQYKLHNLDELVRTGVVKSTKKVVSIKAVFIAIISGIFMGCFYPLIGKSMEGDTGLGPYSVAVMFALGVFLSTFLFNLFFMNLPIAGPPLEIFEYFKGNVRQHLLGLLGGFFWIAGLLSILVASAVDPKFGAGLAWTRGLTGAAVIIAMLFGILLWKEFRQAHSKVRAMLAVTVALYALGLVMISVSPLVDR